jgi:hypothetical protein
MRKALIALFAIASIGLASPAAWASDDFPGRDYRFHGQDWWGGGNVYDYGHGYGATRYYNNVTCTLVQQRFWDGYRWRLRSVQVCG